jgi:hypothetical protein
MSTTKKSSDLVRTITNKVLDLVILEINKDEMKEMIKTKVIHPLISIIYHQLYPYIVALVVSFVLILLMLLFVLIICLILYLKR